MNKKLFKISFILLAFFSLFFLGLQNVHAQVDFSGSQFRTTCANGTVAGSCDDVNVVLLQLIEIAQFLFKIIGGVAFVVFIYGGLMMVLSFGSPDKFKKGTQALVMAVVGMIISFGPYLLINFVLDALQVSGDFRGVGVTVEAPSGTPSGIPPAVNP